MGKKLINHEYYDFCWDADKDDLQNVINDLGLEGLNIEFMFQEISKDRNGNKTILYRIIGKKK